MNYELEPEAYLLAPGLEKLYELDEREQYETSLINFASYVWPVVEPAIPFVKGWALGAIAEHLEAVANGQIRRLLMNVSPGFTKSLMTSVFFPAWMWGPRNKPHMRFLCASYSENLTVRDNLRCRNIILSDRYQRLWKDRFGVSIDQFTKIRFANDKTGWKFATSVGGVGTGERGDIVICLPYYERILTDQGWLPIGEIVEARKTVQVAGWDGKKLVWQCIQKHEKNVRKKEIVVEIEFTGGVIRLTESHPVWIESRGWVRAADVREGDVAQGLSALQYPIQNKAVSLEEENLLQRGLSLCGRENRGFNEQQPPLSCVRNYGLSAASPSQAYSFGALLFAFMSRESRVWCGQSSMEWRADRKNLSSMWGWLQSNSKTKRATHLLFCGVSRCCQASCKVNKAVCRVWQTIYSKLEDCAVLLQSVCGGGAQQKNFGMAQWAICAWPTSASLSAWMDKNASREDTRARWISLSSLRDATERSWEDALCSSYRLRQGQPRSDESADVLSVLPREMAWPPGGARKVTICAVRVAEEQPEWVYNVCVGPAHNYFAEGILVHNCDDPNNPMEVESDSIRNSTIMWFTEILPDRLNDQAKSSIIVIQQRTHEDDVSGVALSREMGYTHLMIPMRYDSGRHCVTVLGIDDEGNEKTWEDPRKEDGQLAWPERFPAKIVDELERDKGPHAFAGQYMQSPEPRGGSIIKRDTWQVWTDEKFPTFEYVIGSLDTAYTTKEENDPSALTVWGVFRDPRPKPVAVTDPDFWRSANMRVMLMWAWQGRLEFHDLIEEVMDTCTTAPIPDERRARRAGRPRFPVQTLLIEAKAAGLSVGQEMYRLMSNRGAPLSIYFPNMNKGRYTQDKVSRLHSVEHIFAGGQVYAPDRAWADMVINQVSVFPKGSHDDLVDTCSQCLCYLRESGILERPDEQSIEEERILAYRERTTPLYTPYK